MPSRLARRCGPVAVRIALVAFLCGPVAARAAETWVQVLSQTDTGCELLLVAPEPEVTSFGVRIADFGTRSEPGLPVLYERIASVAIPGPAGARIEVSSVDERDLGRVPREIAPAPVGFAARRDADAAGKSIPEWEPVPALAFEGTHPVQSIELGPVARLRGRDFVTVRFRPLRFRADGGVTYVHAARVRVTFVDRVGARSTTMRTEPDPVHAVMVNAASAARWAPSVAPAVAPKSPGTMRSSALPALRLRIRIGQRGIYQLSYNDLLAAGVPVANNGVDPRTFRLLFDDWKPVALLADSTPASWQSDWEMHEAAVWLPGQANGSFTSDDPGDRIVFYGLGPEGYEDLAGTSTDSLAYFRHPFDKNQYAWLVWGGTFGRRMAVQDVAVADTLAAPRVDRVWHREHREQDATYAPIDDLWYWEEVRATRPVRRQFPLDLAGADSTTGDMRVKLGYFSAGFATHVLDISLNNVLAGRVNFFQSGSAGRNFDFPGMLLRQRINGVNVNNVLDLVEVPALDTSAGTCLLEVDFGYVRRLIAPTARLLGWSARPATSPTEIYRLAGFGATVPLVLDVTDPLTPVRLDGLTPSGVGSTTVWSALHGGGIGRKTHYLAADAGLFVGRDLTLRNVAPLRTRTSAPDMLIVTHESLRAAADRLAAHRRTHWADAGTPDILVVETDDIYDEFSGGRMDPLAIRNYAKLLYGLDTTPRLKYLLLFGDTTYDMRQLLASSAPTLVPTLQPGYHDPVLNRYQDSYAVDDWLGEFDTPPGVVRYVVPELAIGRLAARSPAEAERLVDKLIDYEIASGFGPWRARVLMVADDECTPSGCGETFHIDNTESLCRHVPPDLDIVRFYLTEYPATLGQKPQARSAFIRSWSEGCMVVNYQGHGAPRQLADEVLLVSTDIPALTNGLELPVFLPLSCTVSEVDDPGRQSMCEDLLASTAGGAIATIGATTPTYVSANQALNLFIFQELFKNGSTSHIPLGLVHQISKIRAGNELNETYILLGDPSLPLVLPHAWVRVTSGADTLSTGERAAVRGHLVSPADSTRLAGFDGAVEVEVRGTDDTSGYHRTNPVLNIQYDLPGTPLYRGSVPVVDGEFGFEFIVPVGAQPGVQGRFKGYASNATTDAQGTRSDIRIQVGDNPVASVGAPRIAMRFPNDRTRVKAGTLLTAEIRDENGINIQGTSLRNSIYLDFDRSNSPLDVTGQFHYLAGSDSAGSVAVPIPGDLQPGPHTATLIASDNLQNTATATLDFQVVDEAVVQLVNVLAFPNPFRDWTRFFFEITDPASIELQIFSTSGRQVWSHREHVETGAQGSIKWDGVDLGEDTLANGTYLFRLRARPDRPGSPELEHVGKVVIMR